MNGLPLLLAKDLQVAPSGRDSERPSYVGASSAPLLSSGSASYGLWGHRTSRGITLYEAFLLCPNSPLGCGTDVTFPRELVLLRSWPHAAFQMSRGKKTLTRMISSLRKGGFYS